MTAKSCASHNLNIPNENANSLPAMFELDEDGNEKENYGTLASSRGLMSKRRQTQNTARNSVTPVSNQNTGI